MPRSTARPAEPLGDATLTALAAVVHAGLPLRSGDPARLVRVRTAPRDDGEELEVGFRAVTDGAHPLDDLLGFRAPPTWAAIGVVATGRATANGEPRPFPVRSVHLVARSGAWASAWQPLASPGTGGQASSATASEPPAGRVDDALRRSLGLPTAEPPGDTRLLFALQWLDELLVAAARGASGRRRLRPLRTLVAAHPAVLAFDLDPDAVDVERLVAEGSRLAAWRDWANLRQACARGGWTHPAVGAATAAWLDDGAFARWVLGAWPELADLHDALDGLLAPSAMSVVRDALAGWGLLEPARRRTTGRTVTGRHGSGK